jgi:hypothetical protein
VLFEPLVGYVVHARSKGCNEHPAERVLGPLFLIRRQSRSCAVVHLLDINGCRHALQRAFELDGPGDGVAEPSQEVDVRQDWNQKGGTAGAEIHRGRGGQWPGR